MFHIYFCTFYASRVVTLLPGRDLERGRFILQIKFIEMTINAHLFLFEITFVCCLLKMTVQGFNEMVGEKIPFILHFSVLSIVSFQYADLLTNIISMVSYFCKKWSKSVLILAFQLCFFARKLQLKMYSILKL